MLAQQSVDCHSDRACHTSVAENQPAARSISFGNAQAALRWRDHEMRHAKLRPVTSSPALLNVPACGSIVSAVMLRAGVVKGGLYLRPRRRRAYASMTSPGRQAITASCCPPSQHTLQKPDSPASTVGQRRLRRTHVTIRGVGVGMGRRHGPQARAGTAPCGVRRGSLCLDGILTSLSSGLGARWPAWIESASCSGHKRFVRASTSWHSHIHASDLLTASVCTPCR